MLLDQILKTVLDSKISQPQTINITESEETQTVSVL